MPPKTIEIDIDKTRGAIPRIFSDIRNTLTLKRMDLEELDVSTLQISITILVLGIANYTAYIVGTLLRLKIINAIISVLSPVTSILAILYLTLYSYMAGSVYVFMLSEDDRDLRNYMYIAILGTVHLPLAIVVVNFTEGILRGLFGRIFQAFYFICFGGIGLFSEYFCRKNITAGRHFEDTVQKISFVCVSLLLNLGAFLVFFPLFYIH